MDPEVEVHSIQASEDSGIIDLACVGDLDKFRLEQKNTFRSAESDHPPQNTTATTREEEEDDDSFFCFRLQSSFSWSDDEFSADMRDSIVKIRQEASRIDAVLQEESTKLKTDSLQDEFRVVRRQLHLKNERVNELEATVAQHEVAVGHLELERDLYKADAEKFKKDLARLTQQLRALDEASLGLPVPLPPLHSTDCLEGGCPYTPRTRCPPPSAASSDLSVSLGDENWDTCSQSTKPGKPKSKAKKLFNMVRKKSSTRPPPLSETIASCMDFSGISSDIPPQDLQYRYGSALETADGLRKRIGMLHKYYDDLVRRLQDDIVHEKTQRTQMRADLMHRISEMASDAMY